MPSRPGACRCVNWRGRPRSSVRISCVPGVKKINILGERPEQIFVEFSYAKLATLGVSARDIISALQRQNTVTPAGSIDTRGPQVFIRIDGAYDSVQSI